MKATELAESDRKRLTDIYNRANAVSRKRIPLTTDSVFRAMLLAEKEAQRIALEEAEKTCKAIAGRWSDMDSSPELPEDVADECANAINNLAQQIGKDG